MHGSADPVDQAVHIVKLSVGSQVVVGVCELSDIVSGEKAVDHQKQIALKLSSHLLLKSLLSYFGPDQFLDIPVQRVILIQSVKTLLQYISPDIQFFPLENHSLAGLSDNAQAIRLDLLPEFLEIADQRSPADIHLIGELIRKDRCIRPHEFPEHIVLASSGRAESPVDIAYFVKSFLVLLRIKNPQTVPPLIALDHGAAPQIFVELTDIVSYSPLADAQLLGHGCDRDARFMPQNKQDVCGSVICKLLLHLSVSPISEARLLYLFSLYRNTVFS